MLDMYRIKDLINPGAVLIEKRLLDGPENLFMEIGRRAAAAHGQTAGKDMNALRPEKLGKALGNRAAQYPIGTGGGILLPLGHVPDLGKFIGVVVKLTARQTIAETPDGMPVDLVFALFGPKDEKRNDLRLLAYIAHVISNKDMREELREAEDAGQIHTVLTSSALQPSSVPKPAA